MSQIEELVHMELWKQFIFEHRHSNTTLIYYKLLVVAVLGVGKLALPSPGTKVSQ